MKKVELFIIALLLTCSPVMLSQDAKGAKVGMTSEQNLQALTNPSLYSTTSAFDGRYEGVKGSPRLLDTLLPSTILLKGEKEYYDTGTDIDVVRNTMLFLLRTSGDLLEVSSSWIEELVIHSGKGDMVFRTTDGMHFDKEIKENKFYQVLKDGPWMFIKIPDRIFQEANYTGLYSPDRRYDEYTPEDKYYIMGSDSVLHRVQLTARSLTKLFPSRARLIDSAFEGISGELREDQVIRLLERF
jgi:hypothetical protein